MESFESSNYTGIGISLWRWSLQCLPVVSFRCLRLVFSIPKAGDFIDSSAASVNRRSAVNRVRILKETDLPHQRPFHRQAFSRALKRVLRRHDPVARRRDFETPFQHARNVPKLSKAHSARV